MVGAPGAYDYGPERCSWLTHHLTNWMGDDGFLRRATCKIRRHNPEGDLLFIDGKVVRKFEEDGRHLVEIEQAAHNQDGELSGIGHRNCRATSPGRLIPVAGSLNSCLAHLFAVAGFAPATSRDTVRARPSHNDYGMIVHGREFSAAGISARPAR